jgi:hypothetical protein
LKPLFEVTREALIHDLADEHIRRLYVEGHHATGAPINDSCPPYIFKKIKQITQFDKRVIWDDDKPFSELSTECFNTFVDSQESFGCPEPLSQRGNLVIQRAREICSRILGYFDAERWLDSCSFGKRAAVGLPRAKSYLDTRFERVSGTDAQWNAFNHALSRDVHLLRAVRKSTRFKQTVSSINATAVPKSFKAARIIAPDTILGGFLSRGLGSMIREQLERNTKIDLAQQQDRHRRWARSASVTGHLSTIDLSKASDSFVWRHIELIVPFDWHGALDCVRTQLCNVPGFEQPIRLTSYMLMGSGHTFPLQTLLFYCLAEATRTLLKLRGKVSVYGDDIIIPTRMAKQLIVVLQELGFTINSEKSFYDSPDPDTPSHTFFRESCGGDYKGGFDVRPYMPECNLQENGKVPRNVYVAWCHKMINGLLDHWSFEEIPSTVTVLLHEISKHAKAICFVPHNEVDHAGIKHFLPKHLTFGMETEEPHYVRKTLASSGFTWIPVYTRLSFTLRKRKRKDMERPYQWYAYWLKRNKNALIGQPNLYDEPLQLDGEPLKSGGGKFRWTNSEVSESMKTRECPI